jgi:hypothetical protein
MVCEKGKQKASISDEGDGWESFYEFFYEQGIYLPQAFISTTKREATL